jgi:hypothetical protein
MTQSKILTNFHAPSNTRSQFDQICQMSGRTRTSVLVELMEDYVLTKGPALSDRIKAIQSMNLFPERPEKVHRPRSIQDRWENVTQPFWITDGTETL